jgi:Arylsulfotransferase (ASST)
MGLHVEWLARQAARLAMAATVPLALWALAVSASAGRPSEGIYPVQAAQDKPAPKGDQPAEKPKDKLGLLINDPKAFQGYTLFAPMNSKITYLIDMQGKVVRTWEGAGKPGHTAYLLENGNLLRAAEVSGKDQQFVGGGGGSGGRVQEFTWDGELVWDFIYSNPKQLPHHDVPKLPNGNVLMICWEKKTAQEATAAGRKGGSNVMADCIIEVKPTGKTTGEVVWEWHLWDHLIQDNDKSKENYGEVAAHPELVDINYGDGLGVNIAKQKDLDKLKGIGYLGAGPPGKISPDWTHINSVNYNAALDQIILSVHNLHEFWIIDHGTTRAEAAGHTGGKSGKGGDLLYRWGNPRVYRAGTVKDQQLFAQHHAHWIPKGMPGEGHVLVFNNGSKRPEGTYSTVDEIVLPVDAKGHYERKPDAAFGPEKAIWSYAAPDKKEFYSSFISGAQRQPNGNTLICSGADGLLFEVTPEKDVVWKYVNPVKGGPGGKGGFGPKGGPGGFDPKKGPPDGKDFKKDGFDLKKGNPDGKDPKGAGFQPPFGKGGKGGGPGGGSIFRVYRYAKDYPGLVGRDLTPGKTVEELLKEEKDKKDAKEAKEPKKG